MIEIDQFNLRNNLSTLKIQLQRAISGFQILKEEIQKLTTFIENIFQYQRYFPELHQGGGPAGAPLPTVSHNQNFLKNKFPNIDKQFFKKFSDQLNFKLKEISQEMKTEYQKKIKQMKQKQEEEKQAYLEKRAKRMRILNAKNSASTTTTTLTLFAIQNDSQNQQPLDLLKTFTNPHKKAQTSKFSFIFSQIENRTKQQKSNSTLAQLYLRKQTLGKRTSQ